jgi:hypothetical protein
MAVRSLLSVVAVLTCLTLNEVVACPTEHDLVVSATQAFSHDIEDENVSTYIVELAASARSSYEASFSSTDDERPTLVEDLSTTGRAATDVDGNRRPSHVREILPSNVLDGFSAPGAGELTLGPEVARHSLDMEDEAPATYYHELAAAADLDPATTGSVPVEPWAVHHPRDE